MNTKGMRLTLLGTGNAAGMPLYGCDCKYCRLAREDQSLGRGPCSALLQVDGRNILLDAGQMDIHKKFAAGTLDAIFLTHFHPDHVQGLFHLRWGINQQIPVYTPPDSQGCADLYKHHGLLQFITLSKFGSFSLSRLTVTPVPLIHSKSTFGYIFECAGLRMAYLTDTKGLPQRTTDSLASKGLDLMVIDCSFVPGSENPQHNNLDDVIEIVATVQPKRTVLTHIGHEFHIWLSEHSEELPKNVDVGVDAMVISA